MTDRELLESILTRFDNMDVRLDSMQDDITALKASVSNVQNDVSIIKKDVKDVKAHVKFNRKSDIDIIDYIDNRIDEKIQRAINSKKTA